MKVDAAIAAVQLNEQLRAELTDGEVEECKRAALEAIAKASGHVMLPGTYSCRPTEMLAVLTGAFALKVIGKRRGRS